MSLSLVHCDNRQALFEEICRICVDTGGFRCATVRLVSDDGALARQVAGEGSEPLRLMGVFQVGEEGASTEPVARAVILRNPQTVNDPDHDPGVAAYRDLLAEADVHSLATFPLEMSGRLMGVLTLYSGKYQFFCAEKLELLSTMAREIGQALERHDALERSRRAEEELAFLSRHDVLTGLPNRRRLTEVLNSLNEKTGVPLGLVALAIDGFHEFNARLGHDNGDRILLAVARRLQDAMYGHGVVGRIGAARFLLCAELDHEAFGLLLDRIARSLAQPVECESERVRVKVSAGVVIEQSGAEDVATLLRRADLALIKARHAGGGQRCYYDEAMDEEIRRLHAIRTEFAGAALKGELELFFQPKINLLNHKVNGVEALIRWRRDGRYVAPGMFLPAIEHTELMREMDSWVLAEALKHAHDWMTQGIHLPVSVNISAITLKHDGFLPLLESLLALHPMPEGLLELEVLETLSQQEADQIAHKLERCRELGISIALDDFGTGASSLVHLQQLPFDTIKIDQRFVRIIIDAPDNEAIISSMVSYAKHTGRRLVVEGVESREIWQRLLELGCVNGQGYEISPPMTAGTLKQWLKEWSRAAPEVTPATEEEGVAAGL